jgi:hypothetical protein
MKLIRSILLIVLIASGISGFSQKNRPPSDPMSVGNIILNFGFGPATSFHGYYYGFAPGFMIGGEIGMWEAGPGVIAIGGEFGWDYWTNTYYNNKYGAGVPNYTYTYMSVTIAPRASYHYGWHVDGLDTYAGVAIGPRIPIFSYDIPNYDGDVAKPGVWVGGGFFAGASYFFTPLIGVNAEFGYNITYAQIGMAFRIK